MSDTTSIIVFIVGLVVSGVGFYLLTRTTRQVLGFAIIAVGFAIAGTGMLSVGDTEVEERPPVTVTASPEATTGQEATVRHRSR